MLFMTDATQSEARTLPTNGWFETILLSAPDAIVAIDQNGRIVEWSPQAGPYLLFVGRMCPEKGPLEAVEIARRTGLPLRMLLKVNEKPEHEYFEHIRAKLEQPGIEIELQITEKAKHEQYRGALATLFPISWPEPFGLVMIESMAAGTPVVGFRHGAVPEIIDDGITGFVCDDIDSAVQAVSRIEAIERAACRDRVQRLFSAESAVARHVELYSRLAGANQEAAK